MKNVNNLNQYTSISNFVSFAPSCEIHPHYDFDGNMVRLGNHILAYDAENRLSAYTFGIGSSTGMLRSAYVYDHLGRRIKKMDQESRQKNPGGIVPLTYWHTNVVTTFVYDGWNLIYERVTHTNGTIQETTYFWGKDLSGTLQGAGGVGGLLAVSIGGDFLFPCYDNNGNITAYIDEGGTVVAYRKYDAFGNTIAKGGDMVDVLHFWFSTKYLDHDTGLYYYGYRYYSSLLQRWINRDPIEENGGVNMYGFVNNNGVNRVDKLGKFAIAPVGLSPSASYDNANDKKVKSIYAGVYIILSDKDLAQMPNGGMIVHGKRVTINLRDYKGKSVINDTQAVTKRITINSEGIGRGGIPAKDGRIYEPNYKSTDDYLLATVPLYYNLLVRKIEKCVEGEIIIKANWYLFNNKYGNTWDTGGDILSGSLDGSPTHGSIGSIPGWPKVDNSYFAAGSYYVTIKITKSNPYFDVTPYANPLWRGTPLNRVDRVMDNLTHYTKWR